jgi:ubiquinone/menaquinone biosynthesis C-methylase UbiE
MMYEASARFYDALYSFKDYDAEAEKLHLIVEQHKTSDGSVLLDVGCGTGGHLAGLRKYYRVQGLDIEPRMLAIASRRYPSVTFHQADMANFQLEERFDVVVCLFSSIGYVGTVARLDSAIASMSRHLHPGGVLIMEPWFTPSAYRAGSLHALFIDEPDLKIARMNISQRQGRMSVIDFYYLVGTLQGMESFTERHELALFTHREYMAAFRRAKLSTQHDAEGLTGRGLYIGLKPGIAG